MSRATKNYIKKSIERLYGIIEGISIDYEVTDQEIIELKNWMDTHDFLNATEPFKELSHMLSTFLDDGVLDEIEREDLLEWCADIINDKGFLKDSTQIIRRLHGVLSGVICDRTVSAEELEGLRDWLLDYEYLQGWWPFNELRQHIETILKDGRVSPQEQTVLQIFFNDFVEHVADGANIHDDEYWINKNMQSPSPIFKPLSSICEKKPKINFKSKHFCFTGPAATGKRKDLLKMIEQLDGIPHNNIVVGLDYLVIGAQASPAWIYSTYGRKIERVINTQKKYKVKIIKEYDFINAAKKKGGASIIPDPTLSPF